MICRRKSFNMLYVLAILFLIYGCATDSTPVYNLTTSATPAEAGLVTPASGQADEGEQLQITAGANEHWVFSGWQGDHTGTSNPASILMDRDKSVTALFEKRDYPLTVTVNDEDGGFVEERLVSSKTTDYPYESVVELTAIASNDWVFTGWSGDLSGAENPETVTVSGSMNVTANFEQVVVVTVEGNGTVEIEFLDDASKFGTASSNVERRVRATAIPDDEWVFHRWSGDISGSENPIEFNFTDNISIEAGFAAEVTSSATGRTWMDRNLGASRVATSSTDSLAYGDLYQWGRATDGHQKRNSPTTTTLSSADTPGHGDFIIVSTSAMDWRSPQNNNLWQGVNGVNTPCPSGYRLPTRAEWDAERESWSSNNQNGAFASPLKLPVGGSRDADLNYGSGSLDGVGSRGSYHSSTIAGTSGTWSQEFGSDYASMGSGGKAYGSSVRCIKD